MVHGQRVFAIYYFLMGHNIITMYIMNSQHLNELLFNYRFIM